MITLKRSNRMTILSSLKGNYMKIKINTKVTINIPETTNKPGIDVSNFDATPCLSKSEQSIFDELVASLFKEQPVKPEQHIWPKFGDPLQSEAISNLSSDWFSKASTMMEKPECQEFIKYITGERKQVDKHDNTEKKDEVRLPFSTSETLLSGFPSLNYKEVVNEVLAAVIVTALKDEECIVTVEDWNAFVENVISKL